jgi:cephalosporin-C deacetylase-like acetyl esterase
MILAVLLAACGAAAGTPADDIAASASPDPADALFAYDPDAPLELTDVGTVEELGHTIRDVTYASPHGGKVTAYIAEPVEDPAGVGILMTPGMPEKRHQYTDPISRFACAGATAMVVDAPWARTDDRGGDTAMTFTPQDADEQVQLVVDLRRAVDILQDADAERIGFDAISYGAGVGAILAGVEDRIDAYALLSGGPGPVDFFISENGNALYPLTSRSPEEQQVWIEAMEPVEPEHFVGHATAPILFVAGREDVQITPDEVEAMHAAAPDDAELRWYDAGHELNPQAFLEHLDWLADQVGLDQDRVDECFPPDAF